MLIPGTGILLVYKINPSRSSPQQTTRPPDTVPLSEDCSPKDIQSLVKHSNIADARARHGFLLVHRKSVK